MSSLKNATVMDAKLPRYQVKVTKDDLVFSAAHFITFNENECERLHGHNYRTEVVIEGPLDENSYVVDFILLRETLREITGILDHHVLLPLRSKRIQVTEKEKEVVAQFQDRRWVFPEEDCVLLPVANTTAELLAEWIGLRLKQVLDEQKRFYPSMLRVEVDECYGQRGICEWSDKEAHCGT